MPTRTMLALAATLALALGTVTAQSTPLRIAITQDEGVLTPYTYQTGYPGYELMTLIYEQLFALDEQRVPQPWLAAELDIRDDVAYHLTLRHGVRWHDGAPFSAQDVAFTIAYYQTQPLGRFTSSANKVASVEVVGELELVLTLAAPDAGFVETALADLPILPRHVYETIDEPRTVTGAMGTGPYRLVEVRTEQFYRLEANPDYWGPEPAVSAIVAVVIRDETATFQALQAGDIDVAVRPVPAGSVERFEGARDIAVQRGSGFASTLLVMDVTRSGLDDMVVRQVIAGSIDVARLVDVLLLGYGTAGTAGFLHPDNPFANPETGARDRLSASDAAAALEAAGYRRGADGVFASADGTRLSFELLAPSNNPTRLRAAELIALDLAPAGIELRVRSMENEALVQRTWPDFDVSQGRDYQLAMFGWSAPVNAQANLRGLLHSDPAKGTLNLAGYAADDVDRLSDAALVAVDPVERLALLHELQQRVASDVPFVTLFYQDGIYAYRPAAYDGWTYMAGQGIIHKGSFLRR